MTKQRLWAFAAAAILLSATTMTSCSDGSDEGDGGGKGNKPPAGTSYPWNEIADNAQSTLEQQFWRGEPDNYYWIDNTHQDASFNHYWQTAHAMETVMDAYERTGNNAWKTRTGVILARIKKKCPDYTTSFYDDMAWMGIACLRAYKLFGDAEYLDAAKTLLTDVKKGWQEPDGGMLWNKNPDEADKRNACTHWTVSCFAGKMYQQTALKEDLQFAIKVYDWAMANLYNGTLGGTFDSPGSNVYSTYNQGVLIGSSLVLYQITQESKYLNTATKCGDFSISNGKFAASGIWRDEGASGTLNKNNGIFKGILAHYMVDLIRESSVPEARRLAYVRFMESMAVTLHEATGSTSLFPGDWRRAAHVGETIYLGCQMSGTILFETLAVYAREYKTLLRYGVE